MLQLTLMKKLKATGYLDVDTYSKIYQTVILVIMQVCPCYVICFGCLLRVETLWTSQSTKLFNNIKNFCVHCCVLCAFETSSITFRDEQQHKKDMPILGVRFICGSTVWCGLFNFLYEFWGWTEISVLRQWKTTVWNPIEPIVRVHKL